MNINSNYFPFRYGLWYYNYTVNIYILIYIHFCNHALLPQATFWKYPSNV